VAVGASIRQGRWLPAVAVLLVLTAVPLQAHHSLNDYDLSALIDLRGTIRKVEWVNPHILIHLDVTRPDGTRDTWLVEAESPSALHKAKLTRQMFAVGTVVAMKAFRANSGASRAAGREITFADGAKHSLEAQPPSDLTYLDWLRNSFPPSVRDWIPYAVIGAPVAALLVGLSLRRFQGIKARS
jgi:hypothetical protein